MTSKCLGQAKRKGYETGSHCLVGYYFEIFIASLGTYIL